LAETVAAYLTSLQPLVAFARPLLNLHATDYHHVDLHQQFMHLAEIVSVA
jgi:hypothetical protein